MRGDLSTTARLACGGVLHERSPLNKKIERINNKIVCGAYGTVVWVQDQKASYRRSFNSAQINK
ncbi:hypothetical protein BpHYR1_017032 [Brachionus plicatilis]|uniref:Uncharacterized protein n=1 Tax=Brachionus plicatilis TaxID=10195 RepID=A0A3M7QP36_BRAPC|nr:hypothetical protein BpHYR1_017032 [Brachionus plicatilis]